MVVNYFAKQWQIFLDSFRKFNLRQVHAAFFDLCFYFAFFLIYIFGLYLFNWVTNLQFEVGKTLSPVIFAIIGGIALLYILIFIDVVVFKNIVWNTTLGRKTKFIGFVKLCAATTAPFFIVFIVLRYGLSGNVQLFVLPAYALLYIYFAVIARILYNGKVKETVVKAFELGVFRFYKFIIPGLAMLLVAFVLTLATNPLARLNDTVYFAIASIMLLLFISWTRFYFSSAVCSLAKEKKR